MPPPHGHHLHIRRRRRRRKPPVLARHPLHPHPVLLRLHDAPGAHVVLARAALDVLERLLRLAEVGHGHDVDVLAAVLGAEAEDARRLARVGARAVRARVRLVGGEARLVAVGVAALAGGFDFAVEGAAGREVLVLAVW